MQLYTRIYTGTRYLRVALAFSLNGTVGRHEAKFHLASLFVEIFCQNHAFIKFRYSFDRIFQQRD